MAAFACDPPSLEEKKRETETCHICYEDVMKSNMKWLDCAHSLCTVCYGRLEKRECPFCRQAIPKPERPRKPRLRNNHVPEMEDAEELIIFEFDAMEDILQRFRFADPRSPPRPRQRHRRHELNARRRSVDVVVRIPMFLDDVVDDVEEPAPERRERRMTRISHKMEIFSKNSRGAHSY